MNNVLTTYKYSRVFENVNSAWHDFILNCQKKFFWERLFKRKSPARGALVVEVRLSVFAFSAESLSSGHGNGEAVDFFEKSVANVPQNHVNEKRLLAFGADQVGA